MIEAVIVSQGDELTTGQIADTNSSWIAGRLWEIGVRTRMVLTIPDHQEDLVDGLRHAMSLAPVVICTGGLGPTRDDLTAEAVATAFGRPCALHAAALSQIEARYAAWGRRMSPANTKQAWIPEGADILENRRGTAPGFSVEVSPGRRLYCLPGVPHEMKVMVNEWVLPDLHRHHSLSPAVTREVGVVMSESLLEERLREVALHGADVGFRASPHGNLVKLRFAAHTGARIADAVTASVCAALGDAVFGVGEADIAAVVGKQLRARGETLAVAESCTGGSLLGRMVSVPGSSACVLEGVVAYSNAAKVQRCGVDPRLIEQHGAVSEAVAHAMAAGVRTRAGSDWALGVTGIAGPSGAREGKPVGTVHIVVEGPSGSRHHQACIPGDRRMYMARAVTLSLLCLHQSLQATDEEHTG